MALFLIFKIANSFENSVEFFSDYENVHHRWYTEPKPDKKYAVFFIAFDEFSNFCAK